MRLYFGKPSLAVLIIFAILAGFIFYTYDNYQAINPDATSLAVEPIASTPLVTPIATQMVALTPPTIDTSRVIRSQTIPQDTTIFIPDANIFSTVIQVYLDGQSWDISQLHNRVGHLEGTSWVDRPGNVVLSGHVELSDGRAGTFANLDLVELSDPIWIRTEGAEYRYQVTNIYWTTPDDLTPVMPTNENRLTLITCDSYEVISNSYTQRIIVVADRVE